eukprot:IDg11115t1
MVPVICPVDSSMTTLLDALRGVDVAAREVSGITQRLGELQVPTRAGDAVFLDTPEQFSFASICERGVGATEFVVLTVMADDGVIPLTVESAALELARARSRRTFALRTRCVRGFDERSDGEQQNGCDAGRHIGYSVAAMLVHGIACVKECEEGAAFAHSSGTTRALACCVEFQRRTRLAPCSRWRCLLKKGDASSLADAKAEYATLALEDAENVDFASARQIPRDNVVFLQLMLMHTRNAAAARCARIPHAHLPVDPCARVRDCPQEPMHARHAREGAGVSRCATKARARACWESRATRAIAATPAEAQRKEQHDRSKPSRGRQPVACTRNYQNLRSHCCACAFRSRLPRVTRAYCASATPKFRNLRTVY